MVGEISSARVHPTVVCRLYSHPLHIFFCIHQNQRYAAAVMKYIFFLDFLSEHICARGNRDS